MGLSIQKGVRCQICTGCGLCPGVIPRVDEGGLKILSGEESGLLSEGYEEYGASGEEQSGYRLIAADIGTTTIAMELYHKDGRTADRYVTVNPQVKFGRDVLSRISASKEEEKKRELQEGVRSALAQGVKRFLKCLEEGEKPFLVIAANTTMSYLLMGWDCEELGRAPFLAKHLTGAEFELHLERFAVKARETEELREGWVSCLLLPGISAFVGGDIFAGIHACRMTRREELTLFIDLGTNGEIALGNQDKCLATATAAGPAFEGGASLGVWGADLVHCLAVLLEEGILDETGLLRAPYFDTGIRIGNVKITQESVRSLQLAKAAIAAGISILAKEYGKPLEQIRRVILAGGFGYYLHPEDAVRIGMLPGELLDRTVAGGNTALLGAGMIGRSLLSGGDPYEKNASGIETINLAMHPDFANRYVEAMDFRPLSQ